MATHKRPASAAGKILGNPNTPAPVKKVAASDLAQAKPKFRLVFGRQPQRPRKP
jgi:hypothetical protein